MILLDRYIGVSVLAATALTLLVLVGLDSLLDLLTELGDTGAGRYGFRQALGFVALTVPGRIYELAPMATLLGALLGLGTLQSSGELTVMRAAGMSVAHVARAAVQAGAIIILATTALGETVAPASERYAQTYRMTALSASAVLTSAYGFWARDGKYFVNIREIVPPAHVRDVTLYGFDGEGRLRTATHAESGSYREGYWQLHNLRSSIFGTGNVQVRRMTQARWHSLLTPELLNVVAVKPEDLSTLDLYRYLDYQRDNKLDTGRFELAFWSRVFAPLTAAVMLFIAVPFVLGPLRSSGLGKRIVVGTLAGIGFYLISQTLSQIGQVYGLYPLLSAALPTLLVFVLGAVVVRQIR